MHAAGVNSVGQPIILKGTLAQPVIYAIDATAISRDCHELLWSVTPLGLDFSHFPFKAVAMATGMVVAKSSSVLVVCRQF